MLPAGRGRPPEPTRTMPGAASLAIRPLLGGPRRVGRVIAVFPTAIYIEVRDVPEPRVLALVTTEAVRLPNSVVLSPGPGGTPAGFAAAGSGAGVTATGAIVGEGSVELLPEGRRAAPEPRQSRAAGLRVRVRRWWDPAPVLGPLSLARLDRAVTTLRRGCDGARRRPGLAGHPGVAALAAGCETADLARAVDSAERLVGLGPGLTPSGDDLLAGLLLALRLLGGAVPGGGAAVWLADWLGAAVTCYADTRTTALSATLLHCAARGQAAAEVAAVFRGIAGQEPLDPAVQRLLATGHTSGADLALGVLLGCRSALLLSRREHRLEAAMP